MAANEDNNFTAFKTALDQVNRTLTADQIKKGLNKYTNIVTSYSGADMLVTFLFPDAPPLVVGTSSTIGYSLYRQVTPVRTLGRIGMKGVGRGGVTFAGTIVFTVMNESVIEMIRKNIDYLGKINGIRPDELPPFDIIITFANELGQAATLSIYGVTMTDETATFSIEDIFTENVMTFMARDIRHMTENGFENNTYQSSESIRSQNEDVGKFTMADLYATKEQVEYDKRLEQLRSQYNDRYKITPMPPRPEETVPDSSTAPGGTSNIYSGTIETTVKQRYRPNGDMTNQYATRSAAPYTVFRMSEGTTVSQKVTDRENWKWENLKVNIEHVFWAEKDGSTPSSKTTVVLQDNGQTKKIDLEVTEKAPASTPSNEVAQGAKFAEYMQEKTYTVNDAIPEGTFAIRLLDGYGNPIQDVQVDWSWAKETGKNSVWEEGMKFWFGQGTPDGGNLGTSWTNSNGVAYNPEVLRMDKFNSDARIGVIASPWRYSNPVHRSYENKDYPATGISKTWKFQNN